MSRPDLPPRAVIKPTELPPHQLRVLEEKAQLDDKLEKLHAFIVNPQSPFNALTATEMVLLMDQRLLMQRYSMVLLARLAQWGAVLPFDAKAAAFEYALIDVNLAVDGLGNRVILHRGPFTAQQLREVTFGFMEFFDSKAVFINGLDPHAPQEPAEAAAWRNLARLANATAAAIDAGV